MTSTLNPTTETTVHVDPTPTAEPVCTTFTIGTLTIEAPDEAAALRRYKRMVRAEGLKAKDDMGWCVDGTNERLRKLGVRQIGEGVAMKVTVTATRTAYLNVDAEDRDEAEQVLAEGGPDLLQTASVLIGRGWNITSLEAADGELFPKRKRAAGEPDDTVAGIRHAGGELPLGVTTCDRYHRSEGYYCTMPAGHEGDHAAGNGRTIVDVWANRS